MDIQTVATIAGALGGGGVAAIGLIFGYIFKDSLAAALNRSVQRDIEKKRAEFQTELETWKSQLESQKERLKHDLSKEAYRSKLYTDKNHETCTNLFRLLRVAEGATGTLTGLRMLPDWAKMSNEEIEKILTEKGGRRADVNSAIAAIDRNDFSRGFNAVKELYFSLDHFLAEKTTIEAKNCAIVNELYMSEQVSAKVFSLLNLLNGIRIDSEYGRYDNELRRKAREASQKIEPAMKELIQSMKSELVGD